MSHSLFAPSAAHRWMACPGSMAFPENREDGGSNDYADDGTATHGFAALQLSGKGTYDEIEVNGKKYFLDEERAARIQGYVDDVRRRAVGGHLFVERSVDLSLYLGENQGGTADAAIALPDQRLGIVEDLKDGSGEKVYASYCVKPATDTTPEVREPNPQLALYALGLLPDWEMFDTIQDVLLVIYQPKLDHVDEFKISLESLYAFGRKAKAAVELATAAMAAGPDSLTTAGYLVPGNKQCRWCLAKTRCPALRKFAEDEIRADFETIHAYPPDPPVSAAGLARAYEALPLVRIWAKAIEDEMTTRVAAGESVIGADGKPYKFVEGEEGKRTWIDEASAIAALSGVMSHDKMYTKPKVITAPQAAKVLDKGKTKEMWKDIFTPLIKRVRSKPILVLGSDDRPAFTGEAKVDDFEDEIAQ